MKHADNNEVNYINHIPLTKVTPVEYRDLNTTLIN